MGLERDLNKSQKQPGKRKEMFFVRFFLCLFLFFLLFHMFEAEDEIQAWWKNSMLKKHANNDLQ